ncbi:MAG: ABC transporter substrate-binding protein [Candidatus Binatota bacterium]
MTSGNRALLLGVMIVALLSGAMPARAGPTPTEEVQETIGRIVGVLQDPMVADGAAIAKRKAVFREVLAARFDFKEMAKRSLGNHWQSVAARQQEFVSVFTNFIERVYVGKIDSLKDTKIAFVRERIEGGVAQVDTQIVPAKGDDFPMNYRLHLVGGKWKIYDVIVENISLVGNYRSQFDRILASATFDELLKKLQEKTSAQGG